MTDEPVWDDALRIAMDAEIKARDFYAAAAERVQDPGGRDLLGRLAAFEHYHYEKLSELARSLHDEGRFIAYQARSVTDFSSRVGGGETAGTEVDELRDEAAILTRAIANEKLAGERYRDLAGRIADAEGRAMFRSLADEEAVHERILQDEFFSISNKGVWGWSGLYGE